MKKTFLNIALAFTLAAFIFSCESDKKTETDTENADTTVVIPAEPADTSVATPPTVPPQDEPEKTTTPEKKKSTSTTTPKDEQTVPEEPKKDWRAMLNEYHEILCRAHKGKGTTEDKIRQAELSRELMIERKKLSGPEQFKFTAEMARAANMETCK